MDPVESRDGTVELDRFSVATALLVVTGRMYVSLGEAEGVQHPAQLQLELDREQVRQLRDTCVEWLGEP